MSRQGLTWNGVWSCLFNRLIPFLLLAGLCWGLPGAKTSNAQFLTNKPLIPLQESRLWVSGQTSVSSYTCHARDIHGFGFLVDTVEADRQTGSRAMVEVQVPVHELDCGKAGMNRDMYEALKSSNHPHIHYELTRVLGPGDDGISWTADTASEWVRIETEGTLTIAGSTRTVRIQVKGKQLEGEKVQVQGKKRLNMKSYGVDPPTALFGLVRAEDSLTVHFDLVTAPADTVSHQQLQQRLDNR